MKEYISFGDTIESAAADLCTRNHRWEGVQIHPVTGEKMTLYKFIDNSSVTITAAIDVLEEKEYIKTTQGWHREVGDKIRGYHISCYIDVIRKIKFEVKEGISGRHGAMLASTKKHTIATISIPMNNVWKKIENNNLLLPKL